MFARAMTALSAIFVMNVYAVETPITGNVASKCTIYTDTPGVYGNPTPNTLSTNPANGGVTPIIRYDVVNADNYKAVISTPTDFSTSPVLNDVVEWSGEVVVGRVTDPEMSAYETNKITYDNVTEFDLTVAGTVWFEATSEANYGFNKSFPGGTYRALVTAECIAK